MSNFSGMNKAQHDATRSERFHNFMTQAFEFAKAQANWTDAERMDFCQRAQDSFNSNPDNQPS